MGVPGLFQWIVQRFPKQHKHFLKTIKTSFPADYLYIDANALLHSAAQIVFEYGNGAIDKGHGLKRKSQYSSLPFNEKLTKLFTIFFQYIKELIEVCPPRKLLYIAIDGPAPLAKQAQQRQRRFQAAAAAENSSPKNDDPAKFTSACMTPGTEFMLQLTRFINYQIRVLVGGMQKPYNVVFSSPRVPGEGEHKILDFIRALPSDEKKMASHTFFGPDGDLLILTMCTGCENICLLRHDISQPDEYDLIDIGSIVKSNLMYSVLSTDRKRDYVDVTNDFILLGFLVGNDFLPKIQMFTYLKDGLNLMTLLYSEVFSTIPNVGARYLTKNGRININNLQIFIQLLADRERQYLLSQRSVVLDEKFKNHTLLKHIVDITSSTNLEELKVIPSMHIEYNKRIPVAALNFAAYRVDYYKKANVTKEDEIERMAIEWIRGLQWVFIYYTKQNPSWAWYYPYHYAPLMCDVVNALCTLTDIHSKWYRQIMTFEPSVPPLQFVQLMCVLPRTSSHLLPQPFQDEINNKDSIIFKYFENKFHVDYEGKTKEYMGVVKLPFVNLAKIQSVYDRIVSKPENKMYITHIRNTHTAAKLFVKGEDKYDYFSEYGTILKCKVKVADLSIYCRTF